MTNKYEKLLDEFISIERKKTQRGSGDDGFYEQQIIDYVNKQRKFWIDYIKFIEKNLTKHNSSFNQDCSTCSYKTSFHNRAKKVLNKSKRLFNTKQS